MAELIIMLLMGIWFSNIIVMEIPMCLLVCICITMGHMLEGKLLDQESEYKT